MHIYKLIIKVTFLIGNCLLANTQTLSGVVIDAATEQPIPFVNIGIIGTTWGTVSDVAGTFELSLDDGDDQDSLRCSHVGYEAFTISVDSIRSRRYLDTVKLKKASLSLTEIVITSRAQSLQCVGIPKGKCFPVPLFHKITSNVPFPQESYRHEIGTLFSNDEPIKLDSIKIHFVDPQMDTIEFRLNVYKLEGEDFVQLLKVPTYFSILRMETLVPTIIDISDQQIHVDGAYLVTVENYKQVRDDACSILANFKKWGRRYPTYYRGSSQSNWWRLRRKSRDFGLSILAYIQ